MQGSDSEASALTPEESWQSIHATMDKARSSMYVAGTTTILLLWGVIASLGLISQYAIETFATDLTASAPWVYAPLWGVLVVAGDGRQRHHRAPARAAVMRTATPCEAPASECSYSGSR